MKTQHKNIFKAGLKLGAALLGTILGFFQSILVILFNSSDDEGEQENSYIEEKDGTLIFFKKD